MLEDSFEISILYSFYGPLLSEKQQRIVDLYHNDNCSLTEIADLVGVSKQAVSEGLKRAEKSLIGYENKLGLVARWKNEHGI
ncbi:MAG: helix-turn-helix domain-containing protein [Clostridia bacterium]|nr:helix-turn-helix domain-containing protein [Clostridia bacterium]